MNLKAHFSKLIQAIKVKTFIPEMEKFALNLFKFNSVGNTQSSLAQADYRLSKQEQEITNKDGT